MPDEVRTEIAPFHFERFAMKDQNTVMQKIDRLEDTAQFVHSGLTVSVLLLGPCTLELGACAYLHRALQNRACSHDCYMHMVVGEPLWSSHPPPFSVCSQNVVIWT
jgi:hypothetical protein